LLHAFDYLTTRQVWEYLGATTTKRATQQTLKLLRDREMVRSVFLRPELGAASELCWTILKRGAVAVQLQHAIGRKQPRPSVTTGQAAVLALLAEMKQLTTSQIWEHLHAGKSKSHTRQMLRLLRRRGFLASDLLAPERGLRSEHYWMLRAKGAAAIGVKYGKHYRRRPRRETVRHRGLLLELARQVEAAGWSLIRPTSCRREGPELNDTPQRKQLVDAVLQREAVAIAKLAGSGYSPDQLRDRIDRYNAGQVGAVVPRVANEYVAHVAGRPELTILLVPHPPFAGRSFWTRRPEAKRDGSGRRVEVGSRLARYARLAQAIQVIAVFGSDEIGQQYATLLEAAGFKWTVVGEVAGHLMRLAGGPLSTAESTLSTAESTKKGGEST
jgi:hypothetical protein